MCVFFIATRVSAQTVNWANTQKEHIVNAHIGAAYGVIYGVGYGYKTAGKRPLIAKGSFSVPSGNQLLDDFSTQYGLEMPVLQMNHMLATAGVQGIYRRFQNNLVTANNFGAAMFVSLGLYKSRWFAAAEAGFDKAIVTRFQHSPSYKDEFPLVKDGWYEPATGGNFNCGLRGGFSFKQNDLTLRVGSIMTEDFKSRPVLPFYLQLGYNYRITRGMKY